MRRFGISFVKDRSRRPCPVLRITVLTGREFALMRLIATSSRIQFFSPIYALLSFTTTLPEFLRSCTAPEHEGTPVEAVQFHARKLR
jgi:hypothetical protein